MTGIVVQVDKRREKKKINLDLFIFEFIKLALLY